MTFGDLIRTVNSPFLNPWGMNYDGGGGFWVARNNLGIYHLSRDFQVRTNFSLTGAAGVLPLGGRLYTTSQPGTDRFLEMRSRDFTLVKRVTLADGTGGIYDLSTDGKYIYLVKDLLNRIFVYTPDLTFVYSYRTPTGSPFGLCYIGAGRWLHTRYTSPFSLFLLYLSGGETTTLVPVKSVNLVNRPLGVAFDGKNIYISNDTTDQFEIRSLY